MVQIGIGGGHNDRAPPTPPGMRVRTGRLKRLRSACLYPNMQPRFIWPRPGRFGSSLSPCTRLHLMRVA
ncbi:hypothetical protein D3872_20925 [Massilia cavernae]|uniref:Uncharacterized protein n=1 Tax=Massilia cavernae TaxID=2320864 RepID=A0A418XFB8_9BURK|nr:hypothetical protein D3872_20925 [Massilia cavernae]